MINFNKASITDVEKNYVLDCLNTCHVCGDNKYTKMVDEKLKKDYNIRALLMTSCSHALDITAIIEKFGEGDEIICPSYTFVSTANAFVLRGAIPIFVDIDSKTLNIDPQKIEEAITKKTKAIYVVHYAGIACDMDRIMEIAKKYNLIVVEDAAQAFGAYYKGIPLGTIGDYGTYSFHDTKNITMGEGGALIVKDNDKFEIAEIIREKGTNRKQFFKGFVDKYTWKIPGTSYLPSDILAALLYGQLERFNDIQSKRLKIWNEYNKKLEKYENKNLLRRPFIPKYATNNAHMYYMILPSSEMRDNFISFMKEREIVTPFHYIPLHLSDVGLEFGYKKGDLPVTEDLAGRLVRLPLYADMTEKDINIVLNALDEYFERENNEF